MNFEEFKEQWYKEHPFAKIEKNKSIGERQKIEELMELTFIKIKWLEHNKAHNIPLNKSYCDELFNDLLKVFNYYAFEGKILNLGDIIVFLKLFPKNVANSYDNKLLSEASDITNSGNGFEYKYMFFLEWAETRLDFMVNIPLDFSPSEMGWASAFYDRHRSEFIKIRDTDFKSMEILADYFLWLYNNCKAADRAMMSGDIVRLHDFLVDFMRDVLASAQKNGYYEHVNNAKQIIEELKAKTEQTPSVFISYEKNDLDIAVRIEEEITPYAIVRRDTHDVEHGDSLSEFMESIRKQDFAILIVSDTYLESRNCMYEVLQLLKDFKNHDKTFWDKVMLYVTANGLYDGVGRAKKIKYWIDNLAVLENTIDSIPSYASEHLSKEAKVFQYISIEIGEFLEHLNDEYCKRDLDEFIEITLKRIKKWAQYGDSPIKDAFRAAIETGVIQI